MPDIDIDFDDEGRDKIIKWVVDKYGQEQVAQIITYSVLVENRPLKMPGFGRSIPETNILQAGSFNSRNEYWESLSKI
jgi:DNA polymerase-3 subunit alpha